MLTAHDPKLPLDILLEIVAFVDRSALPAWALVSRGLQTPCQRLLWRDIQFVPLSRAAEDMLPVAHKFGTYTHSLYVRAEPQKRTDRTPIFILEEAGDSQAATLIGMLPNLRCLLIQPNMMRSLQPSLAEAVARALPSLHTLGVWLSINLPPWNLLDHAPRLRDLRLSIWPFDIAAFTNIQTSGRRPQVKLSSLALKVAHRSSFPDGLMLEHYLFPELPLDLTCLRRLRLSDAADPTKEPLERLFEGCQRTLCHFDTTWLPQDPPPSLGLLVNLETLVIRDIPPVHQLSQYVLPLTSSAVSLKRLSLSFAKFGVMRDTYAGLHGLAYELARRCQEREHIVFETLVLYFRPEAHIKRSDWPDDHHQEPDVEDPFMVR
ncbi:hypothetical protein EV121DRAFT_296424 [Schizophyllum commune]